MCVSVCQSLSRVRLFATLWTAPHQAPLSMQFSRQEYWSGLTFPSPVDLPDPEIEPGSPALQADSSNIGYIPRSRQQLYLGSEKGLYLAYVSEYLGSWQCSISYLDWWLKGAYFYSNSIRCTFITYTFILSRLWDMVKDREAWCSAIHGVTKS